jgi:hypothetical protein
VATPGLQLALHLASSTHDLVDQQELGGHHGAQMQELLLDAVVVVNAELLREHALAGVHVQTLCTCVCVCMWVCECIFV